MTDLDALKRDMLAYADAMGFDDQPSETSVPGLALVRSRAPTEIAAVDYRPIFCLVLQGAKQAFLGERILTFAERQCLIVSLDLPTVSRVVTASPQKPYLALALTLDTGLVRELAATLDTETGTARPDPDYRCSALSVSRADDALTDAMARLFALRGASEDIGVLAPLLVREIHYRLLRSNEGALLRSLARPDSHAGRIARAIARIWRDYADALPVADLARQAGMSASAFHEHFRTLTGTSPLQYQKALRLMEARRRLQEGHDSVAGIAFAVGYESPTQFSREYARKFGNPPRADRAMAG